MLKVFNAIISCFVMMISLYAYGYIIFGNKGLPISKSKRRYDLVALITATLLHTIVYIFLTGTIKTLLICLIFAVTLKLVFNIEIIKSIFAVIIYTILLMIPDLLTMGIFINIFHVSKTAVYNSIASSILSTIVVNILMILLIYLLRKPLRKLINYNLKINKRIILISALMLTTIVIFFYTLISSYKTSNNIVEYLIIISTLICIIFYLLKEKMDSDKLKNRYDELLEVMKTYEEDIENQRTIFHETKNEIMTIRCKIDDKEKDEEIIKYIDSIIGDKNSKRNNLTKYVKFKYLPSNGLRGFFYYKFIEAERKDIKVSVNISKQIENSYLGKLETSDFKQLTRIIGVYLDNAIEASLQSEDKKLGIEIYIIKGKVNIIISNTFNNNIETEKLGNKRFSTKGKNRGHGLLLVNSILNSNNMFESKNEVINNIFIQKLIVKEK